MSLTAQEIRVGNWVETYMVLIAGSWMDKEGQYHGKDEITEPTIRQKQIDIRDLKIISESSGFATYRPIPLTEELLLKSNFHADNYGIFEYVRDNAPYVSGCDILLWTKQCEKDGKMVWEICVGKDLSALTTLCYITNLHQLQNLIFALTNKELTIKF